MAQDLRSTCPVCDRKGNKHHAVVDGLDYFECEQCECLFLQADLIAEMDAGKSIRKYDDKYWTRELKSSKHRSYGSSLARVAEVIYYARTPVKNFIDIGTGAGYLLDALTYHLPSRTSMFYGVEMYPPDQVQSSHPNYLKGRISALGQKFQAGSCIEVAEHLTPAMLRAVAQELVAVSDPGAAYIFNTGLPHFVKWKKPDYLDPYKRGHIMSYSIKAAKRIFEPHGFKVFPINGKDWAFVTEYQSKAPANEDITRRVWSALPENLALLNDPKSGMVMQILGMESIRAYRQYDPRLVKGYKFLRNIRQWFQRVI